jgi:hypothetical protein
MLCIEHRPLRPTVPLPAPIDALCHALSYNTSKGNLPRRVTNDILKRDEDL